MKICHVANYFRGLHTHFGGAEMASYRTALIARDAGDTVCTATLNPDAPEPASEFANHPLRRWENYMPRIAARYAEPVKWYSWQRDSLASRDFSRVLQQESPDVAHFHNFQFLGLDLLRLAHEAGAWTCFTVYDYWMFCPNVMLLTAEDRYCRRFHGSHCVDCLPPVFRGIQRQLLSRRRRIFDRYFEAVDRWIVLSEHSASVLREYGIPSGKIRVVRLTLPFEYSRLDQVPDAPPEPDTIFFAGWLQKRKGVHALLEAMPAILARRPHARLRIAGAHTKFDQDYKRLIADLMKRPGMVEHVEFLGHLPPQQVEQELRRAAVVAIPEQYENMSPLLMIEAMAMGKALVISRAGGIPEYITDGETGRLADPRSSAEFAEKILQVLEDPEEAHRMGARARETIHRICDQRRIVEDTLEAYRRD